MSTPAPSVDFEGFRADSLNFKLYGLRLRSPTKAASTKHGLRIDPPHHLEAVFTRRPSQIRFFDKTGRSTCGMDHGLLREAVADYCLRSREGNRASATASMPPLLTRAHFHPGRRDRIAPDRDSHYRLGSGRMVKITLRGAG